MDDSDASEAPRMSALGTPLRSRLSRFARDKGTFWGEDDDVDVPPLHVAASTGDCASIARFNSHASINSQHGGVTPLLCAARSGHLDAVALLIEQNADVNAAASVKARAWSVHAPATWSAIHVAAQRGDAELVSLLLDRRANIDAKATRGVRPLHVAAAHGRLEVGQLLIARGADLHAIDDDGHTPLDDAHDARATARIAAKCDCMETEPAQAEWRGRIEALASLLGRVSGLPSAQRWQVAQRAFCTSTATRLLSAAERGDVATISRLLERGADANARDVDGATPLHVACEEGHWEAALCLLDGGAAVDARNNSGDAALHAAARRGHARLTLLLCARGAAVLATNRYGTTPCARALLDTHANMLLPCRIIIASSSGWEIITPCDCPHHSY